MPVTIIVRIEVHRIAGPPQDRADIAGAVEQVILDGLTADTVRAGTSSQEGLYLVMDEGDVKCRYELMHISAVTDDGTPA